MRNKYTLNKYKSNHSKRKRKHTKRNPKYHRKLKHTKRKFKHTKRKLKYTKKGGSSQDHTSLVRSCNNNISNRLTHIGKNTAHADCIALDEEIMQCIARKRSEIETKFKDVKGFKKDDILRGVDNDPTASEALHYHAGHKKYVTSLQAKLLDRIASRDSSDQALAGLMDDTVHVRNLSNRGTHLLKILNKCKATLTNQSDTSPPSPPHSPPSGAEQPDNVFPLEEQSRFTAEMRKRLGRQGQGHDGREQTQVANIFDEYDSKLNAEYGTRPAPRIDALPSRRPPG